MHKKMKEHSAAQPGQGLYALPLTPYRALYTLKGSEQGLIPHWAQKREVFRSIDRTRYVVETDRLDRARSDLEMLRSAGWDVEVQRLNLDGAARITMYSGAAQTAA